MEERSAGKARIWKRAGLSGEDIAQFREDTGLTQQELALLVQCSLFTVGKWELGLHCPRGFHLNQLKKLMKRVSEGEDIAEGLRQKLLTI